MKAIGIIICLLAIVGLAAALMSEYQVCQQLAAQNQALRDQLKKIAGLTAENERLSNLLAQAQAARLHTDGNVATNTPSGELARLRSEVDALHQQNQDLDNLRADTRAAHDELKAVHDAQRAARLASRSSNANGDSLEVLEADYGTTHSNLDVSAELNDRIRGGSLKAIASNELMGDPEFGVVKNLTVIYRFGGLLMTNQFREGDIVILPPDPEGQY